MSDPQPISHDHYIGRFRVVRVLGRGSEGVVYLANDPKLGREVAIKTSSLGASPDPLAAYGHLPPMSSRKARSACPGPGIKLSASAGSRSSRTAKPG